MEKIKLRPISPEEFDIWAASSKINYAKEKVKAGLTKEEAMAVAEKSRRELLPEREKSKDQFLYSIVEMESGKVVGTLWWGLAKNGIRTLPWIYDIVLIESSRGKGYGRAAMLAAQNEVKKRGHSRLGLHVFGHNKIAQALYVSLGFQVTGTVMEKDL